MHITSSRGGRDVVFDIAAAEVIVGRSDESVPADVDLTLDEKVSPRHARIWVTAGSYWIEDLGSTFGTVVAGEEIKGRGMRRLRAEDAIQVGDTTLRVAVPAENGGGDDITETLDAGTAIFSSPPAGTPDSVRRLALLCELPLQFGSEADTRSLLQTIVDRLIDVIPGAAHAAVLVKDRTSTELLLKAWAPIDDEAQLSFTSAQQAIDRRQAFVWRREGDLTRSQAAYDIVSGMYAPLLWRGEAIGVVSVDSCEFSFSFAAEDLRLLVAIAQYAAMVLASHSAQDELRRHAEFTRRLFASHFPPAARERLLRQASEGTLVMGTRSSPVTVLISDIRGFTKLTSRLGARATGDLLNEVLPRLVDVILAHDGTIERFAGDAIVAVFGSPDDDPRQHEKAVGAALAMQATMGEVNVARAARGKETCSVGIGVDCGDVLHGFIGDAERIQFAVIGEAANRAARYCDGAMAGEVIVSPEVHERVFRAVHSKPTQVQTKHEGELRGFRVTAMKG